MKKSILTFCLIFVLGASFLFAEENSALKVITDNFGARNYSTEQVTKAELDLIIGAGLHAPSAANRQPWFFTVVQNLDLAQQIIPQVTEGNMLIIVSAAADNKTNASIVLDCSLAVQSIYLAAQALGLGSRIYTGPVDKINSEFKTHLGWNADQNAVAVVRIGRLPSGVDAVSSASPRSGADQKVTYK